MQFFQALCALYFTFCDKDPIPTQPSVETTTGEWVNTRPPGYVRDENQDSVVLPTYWFPEELELMKNKTAVNTSTPAIPATTNVTETPESLAPRSTAPVQLNRATRTAVSKFQS